jgi:hypothetical protein
VKTFWQCLVWAVLAGLVIGSASLFRAHAATLQQPSICAEFNAAPTFATVNAVMESLTTNGHDVNTAANILVATVEQHCPQHLSLLQAYVDAGVFLYPELKR